MSLVETDPLAIAGRLETGALAFEAGTLTCLIGPNGSGKTSLLHALAGIGRVTGDVRVDGRRLRGLPPAARAASFTYLPSSRDPHWPLRGRDVIALSGAGDSEIDEVVARLELASVAERRVDRLSTGERSRILIARALVTRPRLLLLDEPTANLDPLWQIRFMELIRGELDAASRAAIVAMHDLDMAARHADRLIVMHRGRIAADGNPQDLLGSGVMREVFGIERAAEGWRPAAVTRPVDPRSSP